MRNISANELLQLAEFHRQKGNEPLATRYEKEERELQMEMNRD